MFKSPNESISIFFGELLTFSMFSSVPPAFLKKSTCEIVTFTESSDRDKTVGNIERYTNGSLGVEFLVTNLFRKSTGNLESFPF